VTCSGDELHHEVERTISVACVKDRHGMGVCERSRGARFSRVPAPGIGVHRRTVVSGENGPGLGCVALRGGDRFTTGLEFGATLTFVCGAFPLEPDDFAPADVVLQSNPGSE
jgi:hypothetical protein